MVALPEDALWNSRWIILLSAFSFLCFRDELIQAKGVFFRLCFLELNGSGSLCCAFCPLKWLICSEAFRRANLFELFISISINFVISCSWAINRRTILVKQRLGEHVVIYNTKERKEKERKKLNEIWEVILILIWKWFDKISHSILKGRKWT